MALGTTELNPGSGGDKLAHDANGSDGVYQYCKLATGEAGVFTQVYTGNGVNTNALRVTIASDCNWSIPAGANTIGEVTIGAASTALADLAAAEDQAHSSGKVGIMGLAVRMDTPANLSGTDGDYEPLQVSNGYVWTSAQGTTADDAAFSGNPVVVGAVAVETDGTDPSTVAEGDAAQARSDLARRILVTETHPRLANGTTQGATATTTELIAAPGAGLHFYLTDVVMSAGGAQTIKLTEDSGGTPVDVVEIVYLAANDNFSHQFKQPIRLTENVNLACITSEAQAYSVTVSGYIAP